MFILGLTGGIGSGKSAAAQRFAHHGIDVIDSDRIARQVVTKGEPVLDKIAAHFGPSVLTADGELHRPWLRRRIFANPTDKRWLESVLHPLIRRETQRQRVAVSSLYGVLCMPLLLESKQQHSVDRVLVIDADVDRQIRRSCKRDHISEAEVKAIIASQLPAHQRLAQADIVISNNGTMEQLHRAVDACHRQLTEELMTKSRQP